MKFLLDANIPHSAKLIFGKNHQALHVRDIGLANASDERILKFASKINAVLITKDLDFANIILYPIKTHTGVIVLRVPAHFKAHSINNTLRQFLSSVKVEDLINAVTIIEPGRYRFRH